MPAQARITADRQIAALKPDTRAYELGVGGSRGLGLRVFPTGLKQFEFRYVAANGTRRRLVLGAYPDLSLAKARSKVAGLRVEVVEGSDPAKERSLARERARMGETLDDLAEAYWQAATFGLHGGRRRPKREVTLHNERQLWKNHIRAKLGSTPFSEIRRSDVKAFMRNLVMDSGLAAASVASVGAVLHGVLAFAVLEERLESNPAFGLARPLALTSRERMFDDVALRALWRSAAQASEPRNLGDKTGGIHARLEPVTGLAIQLLMLTLSRRSEVAGARKAEFDLGARLWTIPSERAKAKHQHIVPFGADAAKVLEAAWAHDPLSPFVFPSPKVPDQCLDAHAITRAFARTCTRLGLPRGSPHDVRRSGATTLTGRYGVTRFLVGLVLGHTPNEGAAVTSVYDRHTYVPEKRSALQTWAEHLVETSEISSSASDMRDISRSSPNGASRITGDEPVPVDVHVARARSRALEFCGQGELQRAVLSMCLDMSSHPETATSHSAMLAKIGLDLALSGSRDGVENWIRGFR